MTYRGLDLSRYSWLRVYVLTALGTAVCIAVAFAVDGYAFSTGTWAWGDVNNLIIPLILAPPFFFYLLSKLRELAIAHRELISLASIDSLTALLNRRAFTSMVEGYLERVKGERAGAEGALLVIDVDHFKAINDSFGHDSGDEALKAIAAAIQATVREKIDLVGRIGGEEFVVFLPGVDERRTEAAAERIRQAVNNGDFLPDGQQVTVSVGGTVFDGETSFSELYRSADQRLYAAKRSGRNRVDIHHFSEEAGPTRLVAMH